MVLLKFIRIRSNELLGSWKCLVSGGCRNYGKISNGRFLMGGRGLGNAVEVPTFFKVVMSSRVRGSEGIDLAESYKNYVEDDDEGSMYAEDGSKITRYNKKWLKKKPKKSNNVSVVEYKEIKDSTLDQIIETFPQVGEMAREVVKTVMANAALYGFSPTKTAKILSRYPEFLYSYDTLLPNSAKAWRRIGISEKDRVMLFHRFPPLMDLTQEAVSKSYGFLSHYFSTKELTLFVKNNPRVLVEDEQILKNKLDLLWKKYSHSTLSIAKSEAASRDFSQITFRHEFLIRAGFFKPMKFNKFLKFQAEEDRRRIVTEREKYFTPMIIVCSSDEKFLSTCTQNQLSVDELQIFEDILEKEEYDLEMQEWLSHQENSEDTRSSRNFEADADIDEDSVEVEEESIKRDYTDPRYQINNSAIVFNSKDNVDFFF